MKAQQEMTKAFHPGAVWLDTSGRPIQAHGGGVLWADGVAYWYGEDKDADTTEQNVPFTGFRAYASADLLNWTDAGVVLAPVSDDPDHDLHPRALPERPKVLYNPRTRQYVLWAHIDRNPRHVWLPLSVTRGRLRIEWRDSWNGKDFPE